MHDVELISSFIKNFLNILFLIIIASKLLKREKYNLKEKVIIVVICITIAIIYQISKKYFNMGVRIFIQYLLTGLSMKLLNNNKTQFSMVTMIISIAIYLLIFVLSTIITFIIFKLFNLKNMIVNLILLEAVQILLIIAFFKIKRFKNGFDFIREKVNNNSNDVIVINLSTIIVLIYCLIGSFEGADYKEIIRNLFATFIILMVTMIITIQRTFTMHYKQKLMRQTLEEYEREIKEKDDEIKRLKNEKFNISKITHEFYNRQKALEMAIEKEIAKDKKIKEENTRAFKEEFKVETSEEIGALDRIKELTNEYSQKLKAMQSLPNLPLTEVTEIDDMFKYMQAECNKNNIEFKLKISGNIFYLVNNIIPKNKLETMIGDHVRDAIIAVNSCETENKEILVILGIKDKKYELTIYDTGIEFEIDTLLKLGLEQVTTHEDMGGSGIGYLTTFETLKETKASLIIKEEPFKEIGHFTKSVTIRFDNKNQYKICSYRADEIKSKNKGRKMIIEKLENEEANA